MARRLPWRRVAEADPHGRYTVHVGVFVVDRWRSLPRFLRETARVRRRLRDAEGLVGFAFIARFPRRTFTAVTAWDDPMHLATFVRTPRHARAAGATRRHLGTGSKIVTWESYGSDLPPQRQRIEHELEAVPGLGELDGPSGHLVDVGGAFHQP